MDACVRKGKLMLVEKMGRKVEDQRKKCSKCKEEKLLKEFWKDSWHRGGLRSQCKKCDNLSRKLRYQKNPEYFKNWVKEYYRENPKKFAIYNMRKAAINANLDPNKIERLFLSHNGKCDICGKKEERRLSIDHNHETGNFRGFLCRACNGGLGLFKDDIKNLQKAIKYLEENKNGI